MVKTILGAGGTSACALGGPQMEIPKLQARFWERFSLVLLVASCCVAIVASITIWRTPRTYVARTTVIDLSVVPARAVPEPAASNGEPVPDCVNIRLANLGNILMSETVILRAEKALHRMGFKDIDRRKILYNVTVQPIKNTQILAIECRSRNPRKAETVANTLVSEFVAFYHELCLDQAEERRAFARNMLTRASEQVQQALALPHGPGTYARVQAAERTYMSVLSKLGEAAAMAEGAGTDCPVKVIDSAHAVRVRADFGWWIALWVSLGAVAVLVLLRLRCRAVAPGPSE